MKGVGEDGFTLIEALVALAILAIASAGLIQALEGSIDAARGLERRAAAGWVAQNRLAELSLVGSATALPPVVRMLDQDWTVTQEIGTSQDPDLKQVMITVSDDRGVKISNLRGFVDAGTIGR